ncbi:MAG: MCP four helix bundle domain-containing protein, partial [Clostridiaceae bacterium]|nr:MCP four helix bundle domain-containing protein [Clostridiaceae bacterium]
MEFFKRLKLMSKFFLGFGIIFIIFMGIVFFSYNGLSKMGKDFSSYNQIATEQELVARIESNLLYCRIAFKGYVDTGDVSQEKEFKNRYEKMAQLITESKEKVKDTERTKKIDYTEEQAKKYNNEFDNILKLRSKKDDIYNNILITKGDEMVKNLTQIMNSSFVSKDNATLMEAAEALTKLSSGRVYSVKYLETHDKNMIEKVNSNFNEMDTSIKKLDKPLSSSKDKYLYDVVVSDKDTYLAKFNEVISIDESIDKSVKQGDSIGPDISKIIE